MERVEFFEEEREVADFTLPIPENGSTHCVATLCWVPILRESIMCGAEMTWTVTRTVGVSKSQHEALQASVKASLGLEFLTKLEIGLKGTLKSEIALSNTLTQEKAFTVKARDCYELQVDVYQLQYRLSLECDWQPAFGKKKYWNTKLESWVGQFARPCRAFPRTRECGCPEDQATRGSLDLVGPGFELTEPYVVQNRLLVACTTGITVDDGKLVLRHGQGGDARWPPRDAALRDWSLDPIQVEEELLRPFLETPSLKIPVGAIPDYLAFLAGLKKGANVTVNVRVPQRAGA